MLKSNPDDQELYDFGSGAIFSFYFYTAFQTFDSLIEDIDPNDLFTNSRDTLSIWSLEQNLLETSTQN